MEFSFFPDEITASFRRFGHLFVDWPHKAESKSYFPPKGTSHQSNTIFPARTLTLQHCDGVCAHSTLYPTFTGYAFLLFQDESSVQALIDACIQEDGKLYLCVSSPTIKDKPVSLLLCSAAACMSYIMPKYKTITNVIITYFTFVYNSIWSLYLRKWTDHYNCICSVCPL